MTSSSSLDPLDILLLPIFPLARFFARVYLVVEITGVTETLQYLPFHKYIWTLLKNTSKAERLSCLAVTIILIICLMVIVYYSVGKPETEIVDVAPHEWNITREMWLAQKYDNPLTTDAYDPLKLVIIQHTVSTECHIFTDCSAAIQKLQANSITENGYDIPYNFLIGNDGRVYEGRGWNVEGAHTFRYNRCSLGIGFIGDYRTTKVKSLQLERLHMLLDEGISRGHIDPHYYIVPAMDLQATASPGTNLYNEIKQLDSYDHELKFRNRTCDQIYGRV